ncbi:MAG: hypothetical protein RL675_1057 [Bacteroidota bacterium]|jgi:hypothetical protein
MKHLVRYFLLVVVAVSLSNCAKETQQKMVGKWKLYLPSPKPYEEIWTFTETDVTRTLVYPDTSIIENSGAYEVRSASKFTISGAGSTMKGVEYFKGDWSIKSLDSKGMIIHRHVDGLIYNEFSKQ